MKEKNKKAKKILIILNIIFLIINIYFIISVLIPSTRATLRKPILYLYPEVNETIEVKLEKDDLIETSYPKYNDGWVVEASPDGNLKINDKNYYALYWDEKGLNKTDFKQGFYVEKENAIEFLEEKLSIIGLNEREANEFIMYWLPVLEDNRKSVVYFELTEEREKNNKLIINPKPDSLLRIVFHVEKVNERPNNIEEQQLSTFERKGFVAVEWGGIRYN